MTDRASPEPQHVGVSWLRKVNKKALRELDRIAIIHDHAEPVSVMIPYGVYVAAQDICRAYEAIRVREEKKA